MKRVGYVKYMMQVGSSSGATVSVVLIVRASFVLIKLISEISHYINVVSATPSPAKILTELIPDLEMLKHS